jgi:hypothetical protein
MLSGFTPPFTPSGRSALIPPPPWHYAGQLLSLSFTVDREAAQSLLPDTFGEATGEAACHFCEWQATTDGSELLDPVYAQYKEFFVLIEAQRDGERVYFCPFIYVDQDLSMARGWLQGWPKKLGSVWMTRSYDFDHQAAAPIRAGIRLGASLSVKDRRLADAAITLNGAAGGPIGFLRSPTYGLVATPTIIEGQKEVPAKLVRPAITGKVLGATHSATGMLQFYQSPRDELALLQPGQVNEATVSTIAFTVTGAYEAGRPDGAGPRR